MKIRTLLVSAVEAVDVDVDDAFYVKNCALVTVENEARWSLLLVERAGRDS